MMISQQKREVLSNIMQQLVEINRFRLF